MSVRMLGWLPHRTAAAAVVGRQRLILTSAMRLRTVLPAADVALHAVRQAMGRRGCG